MSQESQTLFISLQYIMMDSSGFIKILTFWCACLPLLMAESARMHPWLWSVWTAGVLRPFQLHFQAFHADLEAVHGLNGSLSAGGVIEAHKACRRERNWVCCLCAYLTVPVVTATNVHIYSFLIHVEGNGQQILKETNRLRGLNQIKLMGARGRDFCAGIVFPRAVCVVWGEWI